MPLSEVNKSSAGPKPAVERWSEVHSYRAIVTRRQIHSILIVKVDHVGDFVLSLDAVIALQESFPNARIDLVCAPWNLELAQSLGIFGNIHTVTFFSGRADHEHPSFHPGALEELNAARYDIAIDLRVDPDTRVILRYVDATYKIGYESPDHNSILTMFLPRAFPSSQSTNIGMHQTMLMLRLARSTIDLFTTTDVVRSLLLSKLSQPIDIDLSVAQNRLLVICNTSSGRAAKNWPADRFRRLIAWLANDLDVVVLLVGGKDQVAEADEIIRSCQSRNVISAVGLTSVGQATSLIAKASVFIGNDSGLTHIAARLDVPTVALFSGIDPIVMWAPLGEHVTILRSEVPCSPCHISLLRDCHHGHVCMLNISEGAVRSAIRKSLLAGRRYSQSDSTPVGTSPGTRRNVAYLKWTSSSRGQIPQRFEENYPRYVAQGGQLPISKMLKDFTAHNSGNRGDLNRFYTLALIFDQVVKEQLYGDIAELGVYKGNTAAMLADLAKRIGTTVYLFDTFEGFAQSDLTGVDANKRMEFADTSLQQVQSLVGTTATKYVKGYFPGTASQVPPDTCFCLVHIDCDLYAPFKSALEFFYERLVPGGFLIMHDYSSLHWDGAERAVDEFFADKGESVVPVPDGSGTVVIRKTKQPSRFANWVVQSRSSGFAQAWIHANTPVVNDFLRSGWSQPEAWGVWGLGESHVLSLFMADAPDSDIELSVDSLVALMVGREQQSVAVIVRNEVLATWEYNQDVNAGVRTVRIPQEKIWLEHDLPLLEIEFRPASYETPHDLDAGNPDDRQLGLGLLRFRQRQLKR